MMCRPERRMPNNISTIARNACFALTLLVAAAIILNSAAMAADDGDYKTVGGLSVYIGVVPAELVKGLPSHQSSEPPMHGGIPHGSHQYHVVAAIFDSASGARISDATVTAQISGLGLSGSQQTLDPMKIADTTTYGGFVYLPSDVYTITLTVKRLGSEQPVILNFTYDHRRQNR